ncbi:MAG TPA: DUF4019 domain-containing protein [Rhodanobacteraceae bacterium]|nr:DUF4019 domain-containing protein [Rhodanobacteraceae bacterium]
MLKRLILPAALLLAVTPAFAQQSSQAAATTAAKPAAQKLTPEQQQAIMKFRQQMANSAEAIAQLVDQGKAGEVWDQASNVAKQVVSRNEFVSGIQSQRSKLGTLVSRKLAAVTHSVSKGDKKLPAGDYINVVFASQFGNNKQPIRELVSYHFDSDKVWRVSGYTLQQPAPAANTGKR